MSGIIVYRGFRRIGIGRWSVIDFYFVRSMIEGRFFI